MADLGKTNEPEAAVQPASGDQQIVVTRVSNLPMVSSASYKGDLAKTTKAIKYKRSKASVPMADLGKTNEPEAAVQPASGDQQSVVTRVSNLPLVSSACEVVSSAYSSAKDSNPMLKGVMNVAESGIRTLGAAATTGSKPLRDMLEPQIAVVNDYAMMGLNKMEENLPILQQPADERSKASVPMADLGKTNEPEAAVQPASGDQQSVMTRVSNLPLVSSACEVVSSAYSSAKDSNPMLKGVMNVAESGIRTLGAAATMGSKPLLDMLEPQIAVVNDYAMMGLNKMEENLPILQQPADKRSKASVPMADLGKTNEPEAAVQPASGDHQSVVTRVSNLPLVSSACEVVSSAYSSTKDSNPMLKGVMNVAESGIRTLGAAATTGSKPLLDMLEPQIAVVNDYAMMGLNKMEENLPILQQPADKVVSDTMGMMGMMYQSVAGAKNAMTGAMMGAVMGGVELTRAAVSGGISTVLGTRMGQMVSSGMGLALSHSENWVDQNLPLSERELAALAEPVTSEVTTVTTPPSSPSYFVRLGKLSAKVQERALVQSLVRARHFRDATYSAMAQITSTLDLLESARTTLGTASNQIGGASEQLLQRWREWQPGDGQTEAGVASPKDETEQLEWRTLIIVRSLSNQLRSACSGVVSSAQGLPGVVQEQLASARRSAEELHSSLGNTSTLTPLLLEQSRHHLTQVRQSLDGVMEYLLNNTPLNWLVGPFAPQITEKEEGNQATEETGP